MPVRMAPQKLSTISAVRKQHLLVEFAGLKYACPHGVFVSLTPGDPALWSGVIFVRKGPYAPTILRFQISFPPAYPALPPLITFSTDTFHPLITPLTTYMYTTDIQADGTVSATDDERLPPGGFSLRHGFPSWFGRSRGGGSATSTPASAGGARGVERVATYDVLRYVRSAFDDEEVLDQVPLEAAGNPGAWHAWRSYRVKSGISFPASGGDDGNVVGGGQGAPADDEVPEGYQKLPMGPPAQRRPEEWNWDGVWEIRVQKGTEGSLAEGTLFGKDAGDDLIRFLNLDTEQCDTIRENLKRSMESSEPQGREVL